LNTITETVTLSNEDNKLAKKLPKLLGSCRLENGLRVSFNRSTYLLGHYNAADFSMLSDWNEMKIKNIDILKKGFISLTKPMDILNRRVIIRDTVLLSSAAAGTLEAIGKSHFIDKVDVSLAQKSDMEKLYKEAFNLFRSYAMTDSLITLIHGLFINDFAFRLGSTKLPVTLGSLANKYLNEKWKKDSYKGYQVDANYLLGDLESTITPKGITALGQVGEHLNMFIGAFRGGRNECFNYGIDKEE